MSDNQIKRIDVNNTYFQRCYKKLSVDIQKEVKKALVELLFIDITSPPAKLHLHPLKSRTVQSVLDPNKKIKVYTIHATSDDAYKASFTFEDGTAYLRVCAKHDDVDKNP